MKFSRLFCQTLREAPADCESASAQLLVRGGYVSRLASGVFTYLTLGQRSLKKVKKIISEEMDRVGGQEIEMPVVQPADIWKQSGRYSEIGSELVRFQDRREHDMVLGITHEEAMSHAASALIHSYRQLPQLVYQIQTKFRDEPRARGGLIRVREFDMKDGYSLDRDYAGLDEQYERLYHAYLRMYARAGLPVVVVQSDPGVMGGKVAHEFMYVSPIGEDALALCDESGYAANEEVAEFKKTPEPPESEAPDPEEVHTPGVSAIDAVAKQLGVDVKRLGKTVFFEADFADGSSKLVVAAVRGDLEVNPTAVKNAIKAIDLYPASQELIEAHGFVPGFASLLGVDQDAIVTVADDLLPQSPPLVLGANRIDYHVKHCLYGRDYQCQQVASIARVYEGAPCPISGKPIRLTRGIEVGNIFKLGTRYSESMNVTFLDQDGKSKPVVMGCYGIGVGRMFACVSEEFNDDDGLLLPVSVAPFEVHLISIVKDAATVEAAENFYEDLKEAGIEVLYDERELSPGVKFKDADLIGIPLRVVFSERNFQKGEVEVTERPSRESRLVPIGDARDQLQETLAAMKSELKAAADAIPFLKRS